MHICCSRKFHKTVMPLQLFDSSLSSHSNGPVGKVCLVGFTRSWFQILVGSCRFFFVGGDASFRQVTLTASRLLSVEEAGVDA